jgi:hypothetical protein
MPALLNRTSNRPNAFTGLVDRTSALLGVLDVGSNEGRPSAGRTDPFHEGVPSGLVTADDRDGRTFVGEEHRRGLADPGCPARDERGLPLESHRPERSGPDLALRDPFRSASDGTIRGARGSW